MDSIGIIDLLSLLAITHEAWLRQPSKVNAKVNHLPVSQEETALSGGGKVVGLMDALRKSIGRSETVVAKTQKKPVVSAKPEAVKGIGLVKGQAKSAARQKSAKALFFT